MKKAPFFLANPSYGLAAARRPGGSQPFLTPSQSPSGATHSNTGVAPLGFYDLIQPDDYQRVAPRGLGRNLVSLLKTTSVLST